MQQGRMANALLDKIGDQVHATRQNGKCTVRQDRRSGTCNKAELANELLDKIGDQVHATRQNGKCTVRQDKRSGTCNKAEWQMHC